jgi:cupin 2 domain-containing protein
MPNLFTNLPDAIDAEAFTEILRRPGIRIERIVSQGQATPDDTPMVQDWDEWVLLLEGAAGIRIAGEPEVALSPGDHLLIARGQEHWVTWTATDRPTVWLAVHLAA